jgi:heme exporter protein C
VTQVETANAVGADTSSNATKLLGFAALAAVITLLLFGLVLSPPDVNQADAVRLFYIHVPSAIVGLYVAFGITFVGSIIHLRNGSVFWDLMAGAAAEIGVVYAAFTLVTGMLWGKPTWGVYWQWDPRLTSTSLSFLLFVGYLAVRRLDLDPVVRSRRAAILGIIGFLNLIIVRQSVQWWRSLHQGSTLNPVDAEIDGLMLFSFFLGLIALSLVFFWLLLHRFRVAWLEHQIDAAAVTTAIAERRSEAADYDGLTGGT